MENLKKNIISKIINSPVKVLVFSCVLFVLVGAGVSKLKPDFGYRIWFKESNPSLQKFDDFERRFGNDEIAVIGVHSPSGIFDESSVRLLVDLTEDLWQVPKVIRVDSLTNYNHVYGENDDIIVESLISEEDGYDKITLEEAKNTALTNRNIINYLINKNAQTSLMYVNLKPAIGNEAPNYKEVVLGLRQIVDKYKTSTEYGINDHEFYLTGGPVLTYAFEESSGKDMGFLLPLVLILTFLFLALFFRTLAGIFLPFIVIFPVILVSLGFAGWTGISFNVMTSVVPQYMIAISLAVIIHLLASFYQYLRKGLPRLEALSLALDKNFIPTLLTSISTSIGFFSFKSSGLGPVEMMGAMAGFGTLMAWIGAFLIVSPIMVLLPIGKKVTKNTASKETLKPSQFSYNYTKFILKYNKLIIGFFVILCGTSIYMATKINVSSDPYEYFDKEFPISIANNFIEEQVGGAMGIETVISAGQEEGAKKPDFLSKVSIFQDWLEKHEHITKVVSLVDILKEMNKTLNGGDNSFYTVPKTNEGIAQQLFLYTMNLPQGMDVNNRISLKNDSLRMTAMTDLHESTAFMNFVEKIESKAESLGLKAWVTGKVPLYQSMNSTVVNSFKISLTLAIFLVALLLIFGLGSFRMGMVSMLPNTIPLVLGAGVIYLMGGNLDIGTVVVGSMCLGIAVDDTIHFLANYRKNMSKGMGVEEALADVFTFTIPALVTTTVIIVATSAVFMLASFIPNRNFGIYVSIILSIALFTDVTFLPALLSYLDKNKKGNTV